MKAVPFIGMLGVLAVIGFFIFSSTKQVPTVMPQTQESVDMKGSFAIFTNGTFRVFTASMYHNRSADVFIESSNPNIVRVKKAGVTWGDFFATLPMKLTPNCLTTGTGQSFCTNDRQTLKLYINDQLDVKALEKQINTGDQLLVSYGDKNDSDVSRQLKQIPSL